MSSTPLSFSESSYYSISSPSPNLWLGPKFLSTTSDSRVQVFSLVVKAEASTRRDDRTARHTRVRKKVIDDARIASASTMKKPISEEFYCNSSPAIKKVNALKIEERASEVPQANIFREIKKSTGTGEDIDNVHVTLNREFKPFSEYQTALDKHHKSGTDASQPEVLVAGSSAFLGGLGNGGGRNNFKSEAIGHKRSRKLASDSDFFSRKSFKDLGCSEYLIESLRKQLILRPSHIQAKAFAHVVGGHSCIIADQSGSGKTLAYLAPVIQQLKQEELQGLGKSSSRSPRVVILVPTAELASQVLGECRSMAKFGVQFRSIVATGGFRRRTQHENLQEGVDVLIATPGRLMILIEEGFLQLTTLRCAVFDEVDILFSDEGFEAALQSLIKFSPVSSQYLFVTATLPVDKYNKIVEFFPDCKAIMGPGMHHISPGLEEVLVDCSGENEGEKTPDTAFFNKKSALLQLAERSPVSKTIVFCNKIETCRRVENVLKRFDKRGSHLQVLPFHAALAQEYRLANLKEFANPQPNEVSQFFVCTDRASRGIDFANVDHVVLFDFPRDPSEYVRRVGRTARGAGGKGKAFIFVVGKQVAHARRIIERNLKGNPLHEVPSAYELTN